MKAPEYIPLVMEPESRFYCDPLLVLDFQSLYPSIIMGYNYCYSTCLGRLQNIDTKKKKIIASYAALKYWYPEAVFPPIYFVVADFSTGGTVSENGLLIGSEKLKGLEGLHGLVTHELIHFQQLRAA